MKPENQLQMIDGRSIEGDGPTPRLYIDRLGLRPFARPTGLIWNVRWTRTDLATWTKMRRFIKANPNFFA